MVTKRLGPTALAWLWKGKHVARELPNSNIVEPCDNIRPLIWRPDVVALDYIVAIQQQRRWDRVGKKEVPLTSVSTYRKYTLEIHLSSTYLCNVTNIRVQEHSIRWRSPGKHSIARHENILRQDWKPRIRHITLEEIRLTRQRWRKRPEDIIHPLRIDFIVVDQRGAEGRIVRLVCPDFLRGGRDVDVSGRDVGDVGVPFVLAPGGFEGVFDEWWRGLGEVGGEGLGAGGVCGDHWGLQGECYCCCEEGEEKHC